ncbi:Transposase [Methylobacterium mesophilicum]
MAQKRPRRRADDHARPTVASLALQVKLVAREDDAELRALIERYEQLLWDWEGLTNRALKALAVRPNPQDGRGDAVRRS